MADVTDFERADRPSTAQPAPEHVPGAPSVHDLVIAELDDRQADLDGLQAMEGYRQLRALVAERRAFGLAKYGTVLQVEDPRRDPRMDLLEELGDAIVYAYRGRALGLDGAHAAYEELLQVAGECAARWLP